MIERRYGVCVPELATWSVGRSERRAEQAPGAMGQIVSPSLPNSDARVPAPIPHLHMQLYSETGPFKRQLI